MDMVVIHSLMPDPRQLQSEDTSEAKSWQKARMTPIVTAT